LLLLFKVFSLIHVALQRQRENFVAAIFCLRAHLHRLGIHWEDMRVAICGVLASPWEVFGIQLLMLFVVFALICIALGCRWEAMFAAIFGARADLHRLGESLGRTFLLMEMLALICIA
jgi:hypothetical protein